MSGDEWTHLDTLVLGVAIVVFRRQLSNLVVMLWEKVHEPSLRRLESWLERRDR